MGDLKPMDIPDGLKEAGKGLWQSVLEAYELDEHELSLLRQAARVADLCDELHAAVETDGPLVDGKVHPAVVELRQQRIVLARLIVALRVPLGDQEQPARLQRRGTRGVYAVRSVS